jgi:hypothetical protein
MVEMIVSKIGSRKRIVSVPPLLAYQVARVFGWMMGTTVASACLTRNGCAGYERN